MPTYQRSGDVALLASVLLQEYHRDTPLHDLFRDDQPAGDSDGAVFTIWVNAAGSDLAGLVASFDAIQLAFDAAAVAFAYDKAFPDHSRDSVDSNVLRSFAFSPIGSLQIYDLYSGTFGAKFIAFFRDPLANTGIGAVGGLTAIALNLICPALIVPTAIIGGIGLVTPVAGAILDRHLTKKETIAKEQAGIEQAKRDEEARKAKETDDAKKQRELETQVQRLENEMAEIRRETGITLVDTDAVLGVGAKATMKVTEVAPEVPPKAA